MPTHTKIVCTIGPAVATPEKIEALIEAGMNVARLNFSHGDHETHGASIALLKAAREKMGVPLAIMLDTKGPEIRVGTIQDGSITVKTGDHFRLVKETIIGNKNEMTLTPSIALDALKNEMFVLLDNGYVITHVVGIDDDGVTVCVDHGGEIKSNKGVNLPGADVELPPMTDQDISDILFGCEMDVDLIAASFVRRVEDVMAIRGILEKAGKSGIHIIAKIENRQGIENFDAIIEEADGIMVARGDLGVEMPLTEVPRLQKMMIRKGYESAIPVVTATQMLESMIHNPRPTRAEASDVANAIYDSTSAVMLSAETAAGDYPLEAVRMMHAIIKESELDFPYFDFFKKGIKRGLNDVPSSVAQACVNTAYSSHAKAIFAFTCSGSTARLLARLRPQMPVIAMTHNPTVYHQLAILWGVTPLLCREAKDLIEAKKFITDYALSKGIVDQGDVVVITAGVPFGRPGSTNTMIVDTVE